MTRLIILIAGIFIMVLAALLAVRVPGTISFQGAGFVGETSVPALLAFILLFGAIAALLWTAFGALLNIPSSWRRGSRSARRLRAYRTLADGMMAVEGGDSVAAARHARKLEQLSENEPHEQKLALLLSARAAEASADPAAAERAYAGLARVPGGEMAGYRGLTAAAMQRGDRTGAMLHAHEALKLRQPASWPHDSLFEMQVLKGEWQQALDTLALGEKNKLLDPDQARRKRAVLLTALAVSLRSADPEKAAQKAVKAAQLEPGFPPATVIAARLDLAAGRNLRAQGLIETAWKTRPHPALSIVWTELKPVQTRLERARWLEALAKCNPSHRESRIMIAEAAIMEGEWSKAYSILRPLTNEEATSRLCTLMENICRGRSENEEAAIWTRRALYAVREQEWSDLGPQGRAFDYDDEEWAKLVKAYGETDQFIHTSPTAGTNELEAEARMALPAPRDESMDGLTEIKPPVDFASGDFPSGDFPSGDSKE